MQFIVWPTVGIDMAPWIPTRAAWNEIPSPILYSNTLVNSDLGEHIFSMEYAYPKKLTTFYMQYIASHFIPCFLHMDIRYGDCYFYSRIGAC